MHYEINVSNKLEGDDCYYHFFATHARSITSESKLRKVLTAFKAAFPEPEYNITASKVQTIGEDVDIDKTLGVDKPKIYKWELKKEYFIFGNKGAVNSDTAHISGRSLNAPSNTLCGLPMLSFNYAKNAGVEYAGCPECVRIYKNEETKTNKNG